MPTKARRAEVGQAPHSPNDSPNALPRRSFQRQHQSEEVGLATERSVLLHTLDREFVLRVDVECDIHVSLWAFCAVALPPLVARELYDDIGQRVVLAALTSA